VGQLSQFVFSIGAGARGKIALSKSFDGPLQPPKRRGEMQGRRIRQPNGGRQSELERAAKSPAAAEQQPAALRQGNRGTAVFAGHQVALLHQ